ncbi:MAG: MFS transporter [Proteobacteria bacterium]|nr:MFS transporter [Pseudomonadota bacterium]
MSGLIQALTLGLGYYFFAQIVTAVQADFGTTRAGIMLAPTLGSLVGAICAPLVGVLVDRGWIRGLLVTGAALIGGSWLLIAIATQLWQFIALYATLQTIGHGLGSPIVVAALISNWFSSRRARALALAALGTSVAGFAVGPLVQFGLAEIGWRETCMIAGVASLALIIPPALLFVVNRPEDLGQNVDGVGRAAAEGDERAAAPPLPLLRQRNFWSLTFCLGLMFSVQPLFANNIVAYANDVGIQGQRAGLITSVFALGALAGKLLFSLVLDRIGRREGLWVTIAVQACGWMLLCTPDPSWGRFIACAAVFGLGTSGLVPAMGSAIGACFGRASFGRAFGFMAPIRLPLVMAGPLIGGLISDATGSYVLAFQIYLAAFAGAAALAALLRVPKVEPGL